MLAFYLYPFDEKHHFREYTKADLTNPEKVKELFDYAQILEAYIKPEGWEFLISHYGWEGLYEINQNSGWFDAENLQDLKMYVQGNIADWQHKE